MKIVLVNGSSTPLYEQIKLAIKENISNETLKAGDRLPSVRNLSKELKISILTVKKAYDELEEEGLVESRQGLGTFVTEDLTEIKREEKQKQLEEYLKKASELSKDLDLPKETLFKLFSYIYEGDQDD